jgi:nitrogen regulatory protein PII
MKAVFFVLNDSSKLTQLLTELHNAGIQGATIISSQGMGSELLKHDDFNQMFGLLKRVVQSHVVEHKVMIFVIEEERIPLLTSTIESVIGDLDHEDGTGLLFSLPIDFVRGLKY